MTRFSTNKIFVASALALALALALASTLALTLTPFTSCTRSCDDDSATTVRIVGETMGTYYSVVIAPKVGDKKINSDKLKRKIDKHLDDFNNIFSTYRADSTISKFNSYGGVEKISVEPALALVVKRAQEIFVVSDGAFNITMDPLINLWGFDRQGRITSAPNAKEVSRARALSDPKKISITKNFLQKSQSSVAINLSGIAKGFGVDEVARLIEQSGYNNFLVEIGGEMVARGVNAKNSPWIIGIEDPSAIGDRNKFLARIKLNDQALATSGVYLNFFSDNGVDYSHIIDPRTGYPIKRDLVSVSVIASDCMSADALATAAMIIGEQKMRDIIAKIPGLSVMFVRDSQGGLTKSYAGGFELMF